ncbi:hypothetical protein [Candidatus Uabimicrobium amorphum]|uniref:Uncharacterized protein n=1 Tax=Uabimicrobium amorphum TaxID=2596890 RepID=A0A5S9ISV7_UABAM|nr:hypothetical protein [Candidatus Uabimicrobium amorphum]BBM86801.1 hypothetical protein UABAM_05189 [Candidatus Uabimicrobium amorphum]
MMFHTIVTHEHPDLDAMLCCYLLKKYGSNRYQGLQEAKILFCPAGRLPGGKTPDELEAEGILAVDIGGGRLDTHPSGHSISEEKKTLSAANLVAKDLGVHDEERLESLLEFARIHDSLGKSLRSRNPIDHLMALPNLIRGASFHFGTSFENITTFFFKIFEAIEHAHSATREDFFDNDSCVLSVHENTIFLPKKAHLRTLFACYLFKRYGEKEYNYSFDKPKDGTQQWHTIAEVISYCQLQEKQSLGKIIDFVEQIKPQRFLLSSKFPMDETVSLINIIRGFYAQHSDDLAQCIDEIFLLLDYIVAHEENWYNAIAEYQEKRQLFTLRDAKVVVVSAKIGAVAKVARWLDKADLTVFHDEDKQHISVSVNRTGKLRKLRLGRLASKIRMAEININKEFADVRTDNLQAIGEIAGWFLHQSEKLLIHGSPKAHREPSQIPFAVTTELILSEIEFEKKLPDMFCPKNKCLHKRCCFYTLRLPNCFHHRRLCEKKQNFNGKSKS